MLNNANLVLTCSCVAACASSAWSYHSQTCRHSPELKQPSGRQLEKDNGLIRLWLCHIYRASSSCPSSPPRPRWGSWWSIRWARGCAGWSSASPCSSYSATKQGLLGVKSAMFIDWPCSRGTSPWSSRRSDTASASWRDCRRWPWLRRRTWYDIVKR